MQDRDSQIDAQLQLIRSMAARSTDSASARPILAAVNTLARLLGRPHS